MIIRSMFVKLNSWISGVIGAGFLMGLYFFILSIANSPSYAMRQFLNLWHWFIPLVIGFGVQIGLYTYIKKFEYDQLYETKASVAVSAGASTGAMIACCLHHIVDLIPLLGLSAASLFLIEYQIPFIILGITANVIGITMMLVVMQEHMPYQETGIISKLFTVNMKVVRRITVILSVVITSISFLYTMNNKLF